MSTRPRLSIDPSTDAPSIQTFGELSNFLRSSAGDEDSRELLEGMSQLSVHIEATIASLRLSRERAIVAPLLVDLLTVLRAHRTLVVNLGLPWRGLYEYAGYLQALNNFRVLIWQWLLEGGSSVELSLSAEDFELVAWRTLGEGMLLIDMHEQWLASDAQQEGSVLADLEEPQVQRAIRWWKRLRL